MRLHPCATGIHSRVRPFTTNAKERVPRSRADRQVGRNGILVDKDEEANLPPDLSKPVTGPADRFSYEVIERHGSRGFGAGNFRRLFERRA